MRLWPTANMRHISRNSGISAPTAMNDTAPASARPQNTSRRAGSSRKTPSARLPKASSARTLTAEMPAKNSPRSPGPRSQRTSRNVDRKVPNGTTRMPSAK